MFRTRAVLRGAGIAGVVLIATLTAGLAARGDVGFPVIVVERFTSAVSNLLARAGSGPPYVYAFVAGVVAAFNPCGFALLPAYLGLYLGERQTEERLRNRLGRALLVSGAVTASFLILFAVVGVAIGAASSVIVAVMPWAGLAVGILLILAGGAMVAGWFPGLSFGRELADRMGPRARAHGLRAYSAYGLAYGLASLSCTLPVFLALVGTTFAAEGVLSGALQFASFGLGMGVLLAALTVATAFGSLGVRRAGALRRLIPYVSAALLLLAGAYLVYYWLSIGWLIT